MKIFISGSTGSIGSHLVKRLSEKGYTIHALVRSLKKAEPIRFPNVIFFEGDITNKESIDLAMDGCEQAYHLSAYAKVWAKNSGTFYKVNVEGTVNILKSAYEKGVKKVVVTSTAGVFGPSINGIITEEKVRDIDFFTEYEGSKALAESRVKDFVNLFDLNVIIVSPTRVYGPLIFGKPNSTTLLIDKFIHNKWSIYPGNSRKLGNYIYIDDVVQGHILAMEKGRKGHTYLLGGENHDYFTFFETLKEVSGIKRKLFNIPVWVQKTYAYLVLKQAQLFKKEPMVTPRWIPKGELNWEVSSQKAQRELGLTITPLKEGLSKTIESLRSLN